MSAAGTDPLVGTIVAGRYEVQRLIGQGGMGSIYEVRHRKLRRSFALKRLAGELLTNPEALARFQREADIVAGFRHPNIVEIVDWETLEDGSPCIVMELLAGEDLGQRIARTGPIPFSELARIGDGILSALSAAHRAGITHRDLKPQNIFLARDDTGEERPKLLDFGVSKVRSSKSLMTADASLIGTPAYMAPEQADGRVGQIGPATDVWAMGAILSEMATACPAFSGDTVMMILYQICNGGPAPMADARPDAPPAFRELVRRALSRGSDRIVEVDVLRQELRDALATDLQRSRPVTSSGVSEKRPSMFEEPTRVLAGSSVVDRPSTSIANDSQNASLPGRTTLSGATGQVDHPGLRRRSPPRWLVATAAGAVAAAGLILILRGSDSTVATQRSVANAMATSHSVAADPVPSAETAVDTSFKLSITRSPKNARVWLDDNEVFGDEAVLRQRDGRHSVRAAAVGYLDERRTFDATTEPALHVVLQRRAAKSPARQKKNEPSEFLEP